MKVEIEMHDDDKTQSDYKRGALTIHATDPETVFRLGQMLEQLRSEGKKAVCGTNHGGVFLRIPLVDAVKP